jgi:PilZ domain-containing protein
MMLFQRLRFSFQTQRPVPDRRIRARFEIVGRLPGTLAAEGQVRLRNASRGGALIETTAPLQRDTVLTVTIESDRRLATVQARVCHVRPTHLDDGFIVGLEFVGADPDEMGWFIHENVSDHVPRA